MSDATVVSRRMEEGDPEAAAGLLELVCDGLRDPAARKLAPEKLGQMLRAKALVHEAWIRLGGAERRSWRTSACFC